MGQKSCKDCGNNRPIYWDACSDCNEWEKWVPVSLTQKELEEKLAFSLNGTTKEDIPIKQKIEQYLKDKNVFLEREKDYDVVSKPKHYMLFDETYVKNCATFEYGIEVRDVISKLLDKLEGKCSHQVAADYVQLMQYLMRFMDKNGVEDLKKARWYLDKMIQSY